MVVMNKNRSSCLRVSLGKKASSHFEIIISFILFVGFTLFLVLSLEPTKQDLLEESILYGVVDRFFVDITTNLTSVLVDISKTTDIVCNGDKDSPCYPEEIKNSENKIFEKKKGCVYYIYSSKEFPASSVNTACLGSYNYSLGYISKQQVLSNDSLQQRKKEYYENYNASKTRFGVPEVVDFAIIIEGTDFNMTKTIPDEAQVIAGVYRKKVLYGDGSIVNRDFIVKVW